MASCSNPTDWGRCRKCTACLDHRVRSWTLRMLLEAMLYDKNEVTFLTLTYDRDHLPESADEAKVQLQKWLKRLRRVLGHPKAVRYVAALESGTQGTRRFHWHCVLYGIPLAFTTRQLLSKSWGNGFIDWKLASGGRMAYVLKYVIKGSKFLMSRRPGIGDGMIESINNMIDGLSRSEKDKIIANQDKLYFIDKALGLHDEKRFYSITTLRQGGYYFPLHAFLKKRLKKFQ